MNAPFQPTKIEQVPVADLIPYARNAKKHGPDQVEALARSIEQFGFVNPVLVRPDGSILAGHGRVMGAKLLGLDSVPVIRLGHLTDDQARAFILADNRLAEMGGGWDLDMLQAELADLSDLGVSLDWAGFDLDSLSDIVGRLDPPASTDDSPDDGERAQAPGSKSAQAELTDEQNAALDDAFRDWCGELVTYLDAVRPAGMVSPNATRAVARIRFLRSLIYGHEFPRWGLTGYHPHRMDIAGNDFGISDLIRGVADGSMRANALRWGTQEQANLDTLMRTGMAILRCRMPLDFPAGLARELIDEFTPAGGAVLDPCHGWGGRLVGFLLSRAGRYVGFDPSPETAAGVRDIGRDFGRYLPDREIQTFEQCFEDADIERNAFDFAVTSPPYFDVEKYTGPDQSHRRWSDFDGWDHHFFRVLIAQVFAALKPGGVFALQVGNQTYPLGERAMAHAERCGFEHVETRHSGMHNNYHKTPDEAGEVIVILRKP